ncbi:MAG: hypothetical protein KatS3mg111_1994 [Pirellulaceae bacterium]|nr:MAG: hypothetical protein KatS3mg111_1994 [Pirellulaceae bacterium]
MTTDEPRSPQPSEQPIRARVPDHVGRGAFSTGVIIVTGQTEVILDFVQNLGRPHQIVARVVLPHPVLPQLLDALRRNIELYRGRWGELPQVGPTTASQLPWSAEAAPAEPPIGTSQFVAGANQPPATNAPPSSTDTPTPGGTGQASPTASDAGEVRSMETPPRPPSTDPHPASPAAGGSSSNHMHRPLSAQEIYDDLKIRDELLSGAYANAVMIGHGPHEFSFDFITNFYPHSAVSARVFLAAGQIPRLYDSLRGTWEQLRKRLHGPGDSGGMPPTSPT